MLKYQSVLRISRFGGLLRQESTFAFPNAIKRSPTDLLKALSETVGVDTTAPHFSFIDDPSLIPTSQFQRKDYYLAKELGRRTARQIAQEWPTLFMYDVDEPRLEAFRPQKAPNPIEVELTLENLQKFIDEKLVNHVIQVYNRMRSASTKIPMNLQMDIFRLIAYYNESDVPNVENEEWHGLRNFNETRKSENWKGQFCDLIFEYLPPSPEKFSTMIAALCKYPNRSSVTQANKLYSEMVKQDMKPTVEAFCGLIKTAADWETAEKYLANLVAMEIRPTIKVFNELLDVIIKIDDFEKKLDLALKTIREAKRVDCQPSLRTFSNFLAVFTTEIGNQLVQAVSYLDQILEELDSYTKIDTLEVEDQVFFIKAMEIASAAKNLDIANKIESVYSSKKNLARLPSFTQEHTFYSIYLMMSIGKLEISELEKLYLSLVPRLVGVSYGLTASMLGVLEKQPRWSLIRRVITDAIADRQLRSPVSFSRIVRLLLSIKKETLTDEEQQDFNQLLLSIVENKLYFMLYPLKTDELKQNPNAVVECCLLSIKAGQYDDAWHLFGFLLSEDGESDSTKPFLLLYRVKELFYAAVDRKDWYNASRCLELLMKFYPEENARHYTRKIEESCELNPLQKKILRNYANAPS